MRLNRPEALNSFNQPMLDEFRALWLLCRNDDDIRLVVLQANGDRGFSTGVDPKQGRFRHSNPFSEDDPGMSLGAKQNRVWKPLICAVHGLVAGGAFYSLNETDVIIAADDAEFFDPHTSYGMVSALEPIGALRRLSFGEVMRMTLFGLVERISAKHAVDIRLVSEVLPKSELRTRAQTLAARLAAKPPLALQGTVKAIWNSYHLSAHGAREIPLSIRKSGTPFRRLSSPPAGSDHSTRSVEALRGRNLSPTGLIRPRTDSTVPCTPFSS